MNQEFDTPDIFLVEREFFILAWGDGLSCFVFEAKFYILHTYKES